jgi:CheY-like chemotaxis protein
VDDTAFNIIPIKFMIEEHYGIQIEIATNGKEACDLYEEALKKPCKCTSRTYKLIIMDLGMPVMNGQDASRFILAMMKKAEPDVELTHIVSLTSFTSENIVKECLSIGMKKVYFKPLSREDLEEIMVNNYYRVAGEMQE